MAIRGNDNQQKPKRVRKRKARTEVSSSSSSSSTSDNDSSDDQAQTPQKATKAVRIKDTKSPKNDQARDANPESSSDDDSVADDSGNVDTAKAEEAFASFYLRQTTSEFAEDLDKVRSAGDFNNRSIGMLVDSLRQGSSSFSKDERVDIGRSILARDA